MNTSTTRNTTAIAEQSALERASIATRCLPEVAQLRARSLGAWGEQFAAQQLIDQQWRILAQNWHCRFGEIDLIMFDNEGNLVFIEVKTRRQSTYGLPQEAVTALKQRSLRTSAIMWLAQHGAAVTYRRIRFDVVSITVAPQRLRYHHLRGAF